MLYYLGLKSTVAKSNSKILQHKCVIKQRDNRIVDMDAKLHHSKEIIAVLELKLQRLAPQQDEIKERDILIAKLNARVNILESRNQSLMLKFKSLNGIDQMENISPMCQQQVHSIPISQSTLKCKKVVSFTPSGDQIYTDTNTSSEVDISTIDISCPVNTELIQFPTPSNVDNTSTVHNIELQEQEDWLKEAEETIEQLNLL